MSDRGSKKKRLPKSQAQPSPWPKRLIAAAGIGIVLLLVAVVLFSPKPIRGVPDGTELVAVAAAVHVEGDIHEESEVPAGGAHAPIWQNCGFYDTPIRSENVVHSLEHGAVWISFDPTLPPDDIDRLRGFSRPLDKVLISPVPGQEALIIVTAWGAQLKLDDAGDRRLEQFVNEFEGSRDAPEPGGRCTGGVGEPVG